MHKIFIVDDSRTSRKILRGLLEERGYIVVGEAKNGQEAVDMFQSFNPDIITLDITMPVKNGIDALKEIIELAPDIKVIMVSAAAQKNKIMDSLKAGAVDFVNKPYEKEKLLSAIERVIL